MACRAAKATIVLLTGALATGCVTADTYTVGIPADYQPSTMSVHVSVDEDVQPPGQPREGRLTVRLFQQGHLVPDVKVSYIGVGGTPHNLAWHPHPDLPTRGYGNVSNGAVQLTERSLRFVYRYGTQDRRSKAFTVPVPKANYLSVTGPMGSGQTSGADRRLRFECRGLCQAHSMVSYTLVAGRDSYHSDPETRVEGVAEVSGRLTHGGSQLEVGYYDLPWASSLTTAEKTPGQLRLTRVLPASTQPAQGFESVTRDDWRLTTVYNADWLRAAG